MSAAANRSGISPTRTSHHRVAFCVAALLLGLAACGPAREANPSTTNGPVAGIVATNPAVAAPDGEPVSKDAIRNKSDKLPAVGEVDYSCTTDADCSIKNVGNCCGYYPACVNVDSPVFPEQVKARCRASGTASICGFPSLSGCQCVEGRCEGITAGASGSGIRMD